jgi:hypothetical protein
VLRREPVTPATQEAEMRSILIKHQPGQIVCEILSQKKPIQKGLMEWLKWYSTCLASMRTQVQIPVPQKKHTVFLKYVQNNMSFKNYICK